MDYLAYIIPRARAFAPMPLGPRKHFLLSQHLPVNGDEHAYTRSTKPSARLPWRP